MSQRLKVTSLSSEGEGIGTTSEGLKVFVDGALPGEEVEIEITDLRKSFAKGKLKSIEEPSIHRVAPICPLSGTCGGCQIMHLAYEEQLRLKRERVQEALRRIGGLEVEVEKCVPSPYPLHYRNKIQLPIVFDKETMKIGLYRKNSHEIIPIEGCHIQSDLGEKILQRMIPLLKHEKRLRTLLIRTGHHTEEALVILVSTGGLKKTLGEQILRELPQVKGVIENINRTESNVILGTKWNVLAGRSFLREKLNGKEFLVPAGAFFQVNTYQAEQLFLQAIELASITKSDRVWDAYCGVGTLALFASDRAGDVLGTEVVAEAIDAARENATINHVKNCEFRVGLAEELHFGKRDVIFLNPPRKGCVEKLLHKIGKEKIGRIVYISCDPATLARDLKLLSTYNYRVETVRPFDMFPQTMHVETLAYLNLYS